MTSKSKITLRGAMWHFRMRVPERFKTVDPRREVKFSLKTDSRSIAMERAAEAERKLQTQWAAMAGGAKDAGPNVSKEQFSSIVDHCQSYGVAFKPLEEMSPAEVVRRVAMAKGEPEVTKVALTGLVDRPRHTTGGMCDEYARLVADRLVGKSKNQLRLWRNPMLASQKMLVDLVGDVPLEQVTRADALALRDALVARLEAGEIGGNMVNRRIGPLHSMFRTIADRHRLGIESPFGGLSVKEGKPVKRVAVQEDWIRTVLLAPGALDSLNPQARAILHVVINLGCRPSEIQHVLPHHINLKDNIPSITITDEGRQLKSYSSERQLPLLGIALEAMRQHPKGFPRYRDKTTCTATINKHLTERGLLPEGATCYGLRHGFEDRLLAADVPDRIAKDLMGHTLERERYGQGARLEHLARVLKPISF